jgi:hypothetical protein
MTKPTTLTKKRNRVVSIVSCLIAVFFGMTVCGLFLAYALQPTDFYCQTVHRVAAHDGTAYLLTLDLESNYRRYASEDMGNTWYRVRGVPEQVQNDLTYPTPDPPPAEICDPTQFNQCYRISTYSNSLEYSRDTGQSWEPVTFPFRLISKRSCEKPKATSLVFVTDSNQSKLIVGMGTGGVIIRSADDSWVYRSIDELNYNTQE